MAAAAAAAANATLVERAVAALTVDGAVKAAQDPYTYSLCLIICLASGTIWHGAYRSIRREILAKASGQAVGDGDDEPEKEQITGSQAAMFPVMGSCVLVTLYIAYKFVPKEYLNLLLSFYFLGMGAYAVAFSIRPLAPAIGPVPSKAVAGSVGLGLSVAWWFTRHWVVNDLIAVGIAVSGLLYIQIPNFKIGSVMLWGLFFYDIWWVFGTEVMVSVARNLEAPALVQLPKNLIKGPPYDPKDMTMLGLGDIVVPGFFLSLCLRYDYANHCTALDAAAEAGKATATPGPVSTPFFFAGMVCYVLGLVMTVFVMVVLEHAQPALLYLVPWCFFGVVGTATVKGGLAALFAYDEDEKKDGEEGEEEEEEDLPYIDQAYNAVAELFGWELRKPPPRDPSAKKPVDKKND